MLTNVCAHQHESGFPLHVGKWKGVKTGALSLCPTMHLISSIITSEWNTIMQFKWSFLTILYLFCIHQYPRGPTNCTAARLHFYFPPFHSCIAVLCLAPHVCTLFFVLFLSFCCTCNRTFVSLPLNVASFILSNSFVTRCTVLHCMCVDGRQ